MLWAALASHLSTNVSQYAVDALSCMVLRLPPTCLQLGPPVSARVLWVLGRTILHLCPACLPLASDCLPVCSGWVLWAAGSYTCFPLVLYCLTVRCSVGALGYFLFSFVSCLSPSMPCWAISEAVYCRVRWCVIGVAGACLPLVSTRFPFASQVCSCDFVLWDRRLYFATTCLPLVYRFFSCLRRNWDRIFLFLLLVSHLSFASVSMLSLKWKT